MKFLLLASFAILCTASTVYRNRNISVNDDGEILITSPNGKRVVISRQLVGDGQKKIDISISGPNIESKRIQVQDNLLEEGQSGEGNIPWSSIDSLSEESRLKRGSGRGKSQGDFLADILREYQGVVDEAQYEKLMTRISKAVKKGEIDPKVYDLLEQLDQQQQKIGARRDVVYGQDAQEQPRQALYGGLQGGYRYGQDVTEQQRQALYGGYRYGQDVPEQQRQALYGGLQGGYRYGQDVTEQQRQALYGGLQGGYRYGRDVPEQQRQALYGGLQGGYRYGVLPERQYQGPLTTQYPTGRYPYTLGGQYMTTRNVNPLLQKSFIDDLLVGQQLGGTTLDRLGNQIVQQRTLSGRLLETTPVLRQLLGSQQIPYGQRIVTDSRGMPQVYGVRQAMTDIPQTILEQQQRKQQIELQEVEQVVDELEQVQQRQLLQQRQQQVGLQQTVEAIERLNEIQKQEERQIVDLVEELDEIQEDTVDQLRGLRQPIVQQYRQEQPIVRQLYGQQPIVKQLYGEQRPIVRQLYGEQRPVVGQLYGEQRPIVQQLYGQQRPTVQQLYGQQRPIVRQLYGEQEPIVQQLYRQQQPIVRQLYGQQEQLYGQRQPIVPQLYRQPIAQQWYRQQQPMVGVIGQQTTEQLRSIPLTLQQLIGIPRSFAQYQPTYQGLGTRTLQSIPRTTGFFNTMPQVQLVY